MITTVEKVLFLKRIDLFSQISSEDLAQIAQITEEVHIEEGEDVFQEGEPGNTLFFTVVYRQSIPKLSRRRLPH